MFDLILKKLDKNGDGKISEEEFTTAFPGKESIFNEIDKDGNGDINQEELKTYLGDAADKTFQALDKNRDLGLSRVEVGNLVYLLDMDGDGDIELHELRDKLGCTAREDMTNCRTKIEDSGSEMKSFNYEKNACSTDEVQTGGRRRGRRSARRARGRRSARRSARRARGRSGRRSARRSKRARGRRGRSSRRRR